MIVPKVFFAGRPGAGNYPPGADDRLHIYPYRTATCPPNRYWLIQQVMVTNISYQLAYWTIGIFPAYNFDGPSNPIDRGTGTPTGDVEDLLVARYIGFGRALAAGDTEVINLSQWMLPQGAGPETPTYFQPSPPDEIWTGAWPGQYPFSAPGQPPCAIVMSISGLEFS